ncbi:Soluble lytic murein transglycosylase [Halioglobus japonicus]|nr:Soluble lytic murein transglycosylase [Halioglobus japonicus]
MQYLKRRCSRVLLCLLAVGVVASASATIPTHTLNDQRRAYSEALQAMRAGRQTHYESLRSQLDDYPLAIYLDYYQLVRNGKNVSPVVAQQFVDRTANSPLALRFLGAYLRAVGKSERWEAFLQVMPEEPNSTDLKCYFFRAQLAQGNKEQAWEGAAQLWVAGNSQPSACDPLFSAWQKAGGVTDEIVWRRLLNAFDADERSLLQYVARKSSSAMRPQVDMLLAVYDKPQSLAGLSLDADSAYSGDIASRALAVLARTNPEQALSYWLELQTQLPFDEAQTQYVESAIALRSLFAENADHSDWLNGTLARLQDDKLTGIRLRWALKEQDWEALERNLALLTESAQEEAVWRYWRAIVQERRGDTEAATAALTELSGERDYYGFLAADKLGRPYALNHQTLTSSDTDAAQALPAVARIEELKYHRDYMLAHSEWYTLLQATNDTAQQHDLALLATQKGWHRMAIDAATRAQVWDALDQRFPTPYQDVFQKNGALQQVPGTELMAIARRESAFFERAQSPVGARGLMQIMPATGREVAASLKLRHSDSDLFDVEHNVRLGSAYYRQLLDRFGGNRIFALTAYNAGPHRVVRWRNEAAQGIPVELWVETIPYKETRNYVQAVLSYNVVFQYMQGTTQALLTPLEKAASY